MSKLLVASAGSGKTQFIIEDALEKSELGRKILITTFTIACTDDIRDKLIRANGCIPPNITIKTWYSFLIKHGIKPYQNCLFNFDIKGITFDTMPNRYAPRADIARYFFTSNHLLFKDRISDLSVLCNEKNNGLVLQRIRECFDQIYIDETQDLAGYDFNFVHDLINADLKVCVTMDPRQTTYKTTRGRKNIAYKTLLEYIEKENVFMSIDDNSLKFNHRCVEEICKIANKLYPLLPAAESTNKDDVEHKGIFLVREEMVDEYLKKYNPVQLRYNRNKKVNDDYSVWNMRESKGQTFKRVLVYPTNAMKTWLKCFDSTLKEETRALFYVVLTRAKYSVAIVVNSKELNNIKNIPHYMNF